VPARLSFRLSPSMSNALVLTRLANFRGVGRVPASQIADILQVRKAFFGALLVHSSLQLGFSATQLTAC